MLDGIRHVSFDMWNTLIRFNPEYSAARTAILARLFEFPADKASALYSRIKRFLDTNAEQDGAALSVEDVYWLLASKARVERPTHRSIEWAEEVARSARVEVEDAARRHPPIIHESTLTVLRRIRERGITLSVTSNTNFISGDLLDQIVMPRFGVDFLFTVYSDSFGCSKPERRIFDHVVARARGFDRVEAPEHILHVGDHDVCDRQGAERAGLRALRIDGPEAVLTAMKLGEYDEALA